MDEIINLDEARRQREEEEAEAIEKERAYLRKTLKLVLQQIATVEDRAERLKDRGQIRETRREVEADEDFKLSDSWFSRLFSREYKKDDPDHD
tara:strand:- start:179 stop:457 length:279 start_codon:yes stop_codon:yes gene_type:complete